MHTYRKQKNENLWTVGYYTRGDGGFDVWSPVRDCDSEYLAACFTSFLNGGDFTDSRVLEQLNN